jgi:hypothetical protein
MTAVQAWSITVAIALGALLVCFLLGWNLSGQIGAGIHGLEHWLGSPLLVWRGALTALRAPPT